MVLGGYLSGSRMARNSAKISRHNQCGGPKKAGLAPQSAWMRQGMGNLSIIKSCDSRVANTNCARKNTKTCRNPYTGSPLCGNSYYDPFTGKKIVLQNCSSIPTTKRPATSGGVGGRSWLRFRG
tara:strand:+ start:445 stop:816 length:372 start_codon:yes stop_codon:yes gene_type:complete